MEYFILNRPWKGMVTSKLVICQILLLPLLTLKNIDIDFHASLVRGQTTPRNSSLDKNAGTSRLNTKWRNQLQIFQYLHHD